ncbi:MAG TPA: CBS domain-containing protein [Planctomycetota bacterium]|nr:CBS domain-containing protein [Planctomycetota bacterium]
MKNLKVRDLLAFAPSAPRVVRAHATLREVVELLNADRASREIYLLDDDGRLRGVITLRRLARFVFRHHVPDHTSATEMLELASARNAGDLAVKKVPHVGADDTLAHVLDVMFRSDINEIPVVGAKGELIGSLNMHELMAAWQAGRLDPPGAPGAT